MESLALTQRRLSRSDVASGLGGSLVVHALVVATALLTPLMMPRKVIVPPFCTVNLVSLQDIGTAGAADKRGVATKAPEEDRVSARSKSKTGSDAERAVPVKRLQLDEPVKKPEPIKKIEPRETPKVEESPQSLASVEKNLDKLIPKPKPLPKPSAQESARTGPPEQEKAQGPVDTPVKGNPKGTAETGTRGTSQGSVGGSPEGGRASSAVLSYYYESVRQAISQQWALPNISNAGQLETHVVVVVGRDGRVQQLQVEKSSGNSLFDEAAERAVRKASPLPAIPEVYTSPKIEFVVRFTPQGIS
jgi:colicin import membrane protein